MNEILALGRYEIAKTLQNLINTPSFTNTTYYPIDTYIPYSVIDKEPASFYIRLWSETVPIQKNTYFSLFFNATMFQYFGEQSDA